LIYDLLYLRSKAEYFRHFVYVIYCEIRSWRSPFPLTTATHPGCDKSCIAGAVDVHAGIVAHEQGFGRLWPTQTSKCFGKYFRFRLFMTEFLRDHHALRLRLNPHVDELDVLPFGPIRDDAPGDTCVCKLCQRVQKTQLRFVPGRLRPAHPVFEPLEPAWKRAALISRTGSCVLTGIAENEANVLEKRRPVGQRLVQIKQNGF